jgi:hypothetical protein
MTEWPSVRQCAQGLKCPQSDIISLVNDDGHSCLEYWNAAHKPGDEFVCIIDHSLIDQHYPG